MRLRMATVESDTRRGLGGWVRTGVVVWCAAVALGVSSARAQQRGDSAVGRRTTTSAGSVVRRGHPLKAVQLLEYRPTDADARVRFEWDQVSGARAYRLVGRWTGTVSWVVRTREHVVTAQNATSWTPQRVTFEVPLPLGNHSWRLVAVFGHNELRAVGDSTPLAFAVK